MQALALLKPGIWLVYLDEKTSIQAREGEEPPRPAQEGRPQLHESRSHRRGACHLFAGLSVADGKVSGTFRDRQRFIDFQTFSEETIIPEALDRQLHPVKLILDNGTTHAPKQLERWLQQLPSVQEGKLTFQVFWLPAKASWLDQIESWFSKLQRERLPPNHVVSIQELKQAIADFITYSNQTAKPIKWTSTVEKLENKLKQRIDKKDGWTSEYHPKQKIGQKSSQKLRQKLGTHL